MAPIPTGWGGNHPGAEGRPGASTSTSLGAGARVRRGRQDLGPPPRLSTSGFPSRDAAFFLPVPGAPRPRPPGAQRGAARPDSGLRPPRPSACTPPGPRNPSGPRTPTWAPHPPRALSLHSLFNEPGRLGAVTALQEQEQELELDGEQLQARRLMAVEAGPAGERPATTQQERDAPPRALPPKRRQLVLLKIFEFGAQIRIVQWDAPLAHAFQWEGGEKGRPHPSPMGGCRGGASREAAPPRSRPAPCARKDAEAGGGAWAGPRSAGRPRPSHTWREPTTHAPTRPASLGGGSGPAASPDLLLKAAPAPLRRSPVGSKGGRLSPAISGAAGW